MNRRNIIKITALGALSLAIPQVFASPNIDDVDWKELGIIKTGTVTYSNGVVVSDWHIDAKTAESKLPKGEGVLTIDMKNKEVLIFGKRSEKLTRKFIASFQENSAL